MKRTTVLLLLLLIVILTSAYGQEDVEPQSGLKTEFLCELKANTIHIESNGWTLAGTRQSALSGQRSLSGEIGRSGDVHAGPD